VIAVYNLCKW